MIAKVSTAEPSSTETPGALPSGARLELETGHLHYVDVGSGSPVVLVHGSPVSSYTFRAQSPALAADHRVIAPDLLGFGKSRGPASGASFREQADALRTLLDRLELGRYSLVGHDWGGPIGLSAACRQPAELTDLILINTTVFSDFRPPLYWRPWVAGPLGRLFVVGLNLPGRLLRQLMRSARDPEVRRRYADPLSDRATRRAVLALEQLRDYEEVMAAVQSSLPEVRTLILWGHPDAYFRSKELRRLSQRFPKAVICELADAGHFPQEDAPEAVTDALVRFLAR